MSNIVLLDCVNVMTHPALQSLPMLMRVCLKEGMTWPSLAAGGRDGWSRAPEAEDVRSWLVVVPTRTVGAQ